MATRYEPACDKFEEYRATVAKIWAAFHIELGNIDSPPTKSNNFTSGYASLYKDVPVCYPPKNETGHLLHAFADPVYNRMRSPASCSSGPESTATKSARMVRSTVAELNAKEEERPRTMTAHKNYAVYYRKSLCFGSYGRQVWFKVALAYVTQLLKHGLPVLIVHQICWI